MGGLYNQDMVNDLIRRTLADAPRGTKARLAREIGVEPPTITKWVQGHTSPEPSRWEAIEDSLGLDRGDLRVAGGLPRHGSLPPGTPDGRLLVEHVDPDEQTDFVGYFSEPEVVDLLVLGGFSEEQAQEFVAEAVAARQQPPAHPKRPARRPRRSR